MKPRRTILIHVSKGGAIKRTHSVPLVLSLAAIMAMALAVFSGFIGYKLHLLRYDTSRIDLMKEKNAEQAGTIKDLSKKITALDEELSVLKAYNRRLKAASRILLDHPENMMGMGGSDEDFSHGSRGVSVLPGRAIDFELDSHVERLGEDIALEQEIAKNLISEIDRQKSLIAHIPSLCPSQGFFSSRFGWRNSPFSDMTEFHKGIDIASLESTPVYAAADGTVSDYYSSESYGNVLLIDHGNGIMTKYSHLLDSSLEIGRRVEKGEKIASIGNSGRSTGSHLHYEILINGVNVNPLRYMLK